MRRAVLAASLASLALTGVAQPVRPHHGPGGKAGLHPLLRRVLEQGFHLRLAGTRVVQVLQGGERKLVTERVLRDGPRIRTEVIADGAMVGQISIEEGGTRRIYDPKLNEIREAPPREAEATMRLIRLFGRGRGQAALGETDGGAVAGVGTRLVELRMPSGEVAARAWIEPVHGAVLKLQSFGRDGQLNGSVEYTQVDFNPRFPVGAFEFNKPGARVVTLAQEAVIKARELSFQLAKLPPEWKLVGVRKLTPAGVKVLMQSFTNAGRRVSLFQIQGSVDPQRLSRLAGRAAGSYVWDWNGYRMALLGDLPQDALRRLADKVSS